MTLVLDGGGIDSLAGQRIQLTTLIRRGDWPPRVPAVVLAEALTGDHRRDVHRNRLLGMCQIRAVTELHARTAARLRGNLTRPGLVSATDAIVAAFATTMPDAVVLTSDPKHMRALLDGTAVSVSAV